MVASEQACARPPIPRGHGFIKSTPLEGWAAPPPWWWCLVGDLCFLCGFWLVTRQSDVSYLRFRGVTKWPTQACTPYLSCYYALTAAATKKQLSAVVRACWMWFNMHWRLPNSRLINQHHWRSIEITQARGEPIFVKFSALVCSSSVCFLAGLKNWQEASEVDPLLKRSILIWTMANLIRMTVLVWFMILLDLCVSVSCCCCWFWWHHTHSSEGVLRICTS